MKGPHRIQISFREWSHPTSATGTIEWKLLALDCDDSLVIRCRVKLREERFSSLLVLDLRSSYEHAWPAFVAGLTKVTAGKRRRAVYRQDESLTLKLLHREDQFWIALDSHHRWKLHPVVIAPEEMQRLTDFLLRLGERYDKCAQAYRTKHPGTNQGRIAP